MNNHVNDPTESVNLDQLREPWLEDLLQPPTVASELCIQRLFSCIISVLASYIITRAESMLLLLQLQNGNTVLLKLYKINMLIPLGHT